MTGHVPVHPSAIAPHGPVRQDRDHTDDEHGEYREDGDNRWVEAGRRVIRQPRKLHLERNEHEQSEDPDPEYIPDQLAERPFVPPNPSVSLEACSDAIGGIGTDSDFRSAGRRVDGGRRVLG